MSDPISDLKQELLVAAERQHGLGSATTGRGRFRAHPRRNRVLLLAATLPIAVVVALFLTAPWSNPPGFLERAQAALTPPKGAIFHQRVETTLTSADYGCALTGIDEVWIDQERPTRWRARVSNYLGDDVPGARTDMREWACRDRGSTELGRSTATLGTLIFVPPDTLTVSPQDYLNAPGHTDYVTWLRDAIANGSAHDEGETELDGRTVERIRFDPRCPGSPCPGPPAYAYVDPETYFPVQIEARYAYTIANPGGVLRYHTVQRFLTFEYLPRTPANLALTDIRAQHRDAARP